MSVRTPKRKLSEDAQPMQFSPSLAGLVPTSPFVDGGAKGASGYWPSDDSDFFPTSNGGGEAAEYSYSAPLAVEPRQDSDLFPRRTPSEQERYMQALRAKTEHRQREVVRHSTHTVNGAVDVRPKFWTAYYAFKAPYALKGFRDRAVFYRTLKYVGKAQQIIDITEEDAKRLVLRHTVDTVESEIQKLADDANARDPPALRGARVWSEMERAGKQALADKAFFEREDKAANELLAVVKNDEKGVAANPPDYTTAARRSRAAYSNQLRVTQEALDRWTVSGRRYERLQVDCNRLGLSRPPDDFNVPGTYEGHLLRLEYKLERAKEMMFADRWVYERETNVALQMHSTMRSDEAKTDERAKRRSQMAYGNQSRVVKAAEARWEQSNARVLRFGEELRKARALPNRAQFQ